MNCKVKPGQKYSYDCSLDAAHLNTVIVKKIERNSIGKGHMVILREADQMGYRAFNCEYFQPNKNGKKLPFTRTSK